MLLTSKVQKLLLFMLLLVLQISGLQFFAQAEDLNIISISSPLAYSAKSGLIDFSGEIKPGAQGSPEIKRIGIVLKAIEVEDQYSSGRYFFNFYYRNSLGSSVDTWGLYYPERNWSFDNSLGGKFTITSDSSNWPIGSYEFTILVLDSKDNVVATKPIRFYVGNAKEAQPTISAPTSVEVIDGIATIVAKVQRNEFTKSPIAKVDVIGLNGFLVKSTISQDDKLTLTIDYFRKERRSFYITITDANGLMVSSKPVDIIPETKIRKIKMICVAPNAAIAFTAFNFKCSSENIDESSRILIRYQYRYLDSKNWQDITSDYYFGNSLNFELVPQAAGIQFYRILYEGVDERYSVENYDQIAPFASNEVKVNVSKNPITRLTVKVSYPRVVVLGKSYTAQVSTTPSSNGNCSYYLFYRMRILVGQSNLKNGKSSLKFPAAVLGTDVGNPATLTVVCTAGKSTGSGFAAFNWVRT